MNQNQLDNATAPRSVDQQQACSACHTKRKCGVCLCVLDGTNANGGTGPYRGGRMCSNCYTTIAAWERIKLRFATDAPRPAIRLAQCNVCGQPNDEMRDSER